MTNPIISLLVPIYKVEPYIEKCARSLFEQTYQNLEYVFVDDCTPDDSLVILERVLKDYPQREKQVKIVHHQVNRGLAAARNTAIDNATGEYVTIVDSDDYLPLDSVETLYATAVDCQADIATGNTVMIKGREMELTQLKKEVVTQIADKCNLLRYVWAPGKLYKRTLFNRVHWREKYDMGEDRNTVPLLYYYAQRIAVTDTPVYYYQTNPQSFSKNRDTVQAHLYEFYIGARLLYTTFLQLPNGRQYIKWLSIRTFRSKIYQIKHAFPDYSFIKTIAQVPDKMFGSYSQLPLKESVFLYLASAKCYLLLYIVTGMQRLLVRCRKLCNIK